MRCVGLAVAVTFMVAATASARDVPKLQARVNDYANLLTSTQKTQLEQYLAAEEEKSSNQIVVLTIKSLEGEEIMPFSQKTYREWKLGDKVKNNGVLVVVAIADRKMRIHTGRGLEGALPDALCFEICEEQMKPKFRESKFYDGINDAVVKIVAAVHGEYKGSAKPAAALSNQDVCALTGYVVILLVIFVICAGINEEPNILSGIIGCIGVALVTFLFFHTPGGTFIAAVIGFFVGAFARPIASGIGDAGSSIGDSISSSDWSSGSSGGSSFSGGGGDSGGGGADSGW